MENREFSNNFKVNFCSETTAACSPKKSTARSDFKALCFGFQVSNNVLINGLNTRRRNLRNPPSASRDNSYRLHKLFTPIYLITVKSRLYTVSSYPFGY